MSRPASLAITLLVTLCGTAPAATLQQLSMDEMSKQATSIVRASVSGSYTTVLNSTIYTHYRLQVSETWKGIAPAELMLPGGVANGARQSFPGVPDLTSGSEYVLFLWKSSSTGITHVLGLTQGLYNVSLQADGSALAWRPKIGEMMLDANGRKVADQPVSMKLSDLKGRVRQISGTIGLTK